MNNDRVVEVATIEQIVCACIAPGEKLKNKSTAWFSHRHPALQSALDKGYVVEKNRVRHSPDLLGGWLVEVEITQKGILLVGEIVHKYIMRESAF